MNSNRLIELAKYLFTNQNLHKRPFGNLEAIVVARNVRDLEFAKLEINAVLREYNFVAAINCFEFLTVHKFDQYIAGRTNIVTYIQYEPYTLTDDQERDILTRIVCTQGDSKFAPMIIKAGPRDFWRYRPSNAKGGQASFVW